MAEISFESNSLGAFEPGSWTATPQERGGLTPEERLFLRLHAVYGPVMSLRGAGKFFDRAEMRSLPVFRAPRRNARYVNTTAVAARLLCKLPPSLPPVPGWQKEPFSLDASLDGSIRVLGTELSAFMARSMSLFELTLNSLHAMHGPLMDTASAAQLLNFKTPIALTQSIGQGTLALRLVTHPRKRKPFLSTQAVARHLAQAASFGMAATRVEKKGTSLLTGC